MEADIVRVSLRMPKKMHQALVSLAINDERSMHTTILRLLRDGIARESNDEQ